MIEMAKRAETLLILEISFPKSPKKAAQRRELLKKMRSLIEQEGESLPFKDVTSKRNRINLTTEEFLSSVTFTKSLPVMILLKNPAENIEEGNKLGNTLVNYVNTIFGNYAKGAKVSSNEMTPWKKGQFNLARKLIGERKIAKINELIKKTLNPIGILFEYSVEDRTNVVLTVQRGEEIGSLVFSDYTLKNTLPWDLISNEYAALVDCMKIIDKISAVEI